MTADIPRRGMSTSQFARLHGVHITTVWRWIEEGKVQAIKTPGGLHWRIVVEPKLEKNPSKP